MKLKTLAISFFIIVGILTIIYFFSQRLSPSSTTEERIIRKNLLQSEALINASKIKLYRAEDSSSLTIEKNMNGLWVVMDSNGFPIDFKKLQNLIQPLLETNIVRTTSDPKHIEKMGIGAYEITIIGKENNILWSMESGDRNESGELFVRIKEEPEVLLVDLPSFSFETDENSWRRKIFFNFDQSAVAQLAITFPDTAEPFVVSRNSPEAIFSSKSLDPDQKIKQKAILDLIEQILNTHYAEIVPINSAATPLADNPSRLFTFTLFNGTHHTLEITPYMEKSDNNVNVVDLSETLHLDEELNNSESLEQVEENDLLEKGQPLTEDLEEALTLTENETEETELLEEIPSEGLNKLGEMKDVAGENKDEEVDKSPNKDVESSDNIFLFSSSEKVSLAEDSLPKDKKKGLTSDTDKKNRWLSRVPFLSKQKETGLKLDITLFGKKAIKIEIPSLEENALKTEKPGLEKIFVNKEARWSFTKAPLLSKQKETEKASEEALPEEKMENPLLEEKALETEESDLEKISVNKKSRWRFFQVPLLSEQEEIEKASEEALSEEKMETPLLEEKALEIEKTDLEETSVNKKSRWRFFRVPFLSKDKQKETETEKPSEEILSEEKVEPILEEDIPETGLDENDDLLEPSMEDFWEDEFSEQPQERTLYLENKSSEEKVVSFEPQNTSEKEFYGSRSPVIQDEFPLQQSNSDDSNTNHLEGKLLIFYKTSHSRNPWG